MKFNSWVPLYTIERAGIDELTVFGAVAFWQGGKLIHQIGTDPLIYGRSLMKPFQMKVFANDLKDELSATEKAVSVASHAGQEMHLLTIAAMGDSETRKYMQLPVKHTCTGKHVAILRGCEKRGWPLANYTGSEHPYHHAYLQVLRQYLGEGWRPEVTAVDGCGLPTLSMRVSELAKLYAELGSRRQDDWIFHAMTTQPDYVGGTGRLDTNLMKIGEGAIVAKEGADGLLGLSLLPKNSLRLAKEPIGIVIKIAQGYDQTSLAILANEVLSPLGYKLPASEFYQLRPILPRAQFHV